MISHMFALGLAYFAYRAVRHYAYDQHFSLGTWKIEILAGYSSAILLMVVVGFMAFHSIQRLFSPVQIHYNEAIPIAILGLLVNLISAWLLHDGHHHASEVHHHPYDLNQKAAFMHVVDEIRQVLAELPQTTLIDLHVWKIGKGKFSCILALETTVDLTADRVRAMLSIHEEIIHVSVEINSTAQTVPRETLTSS